MKTDFTQVLVYFFKLILGITFIWASYSKIEDPAGFARILHGYDVFPAVSINLIAVIVPFIELVAGFSLIMRLLPKSALFIINSMLVFFILVIGFNLIRGHEFDCGCFSVAGQDGTTSAYLLLARDVLFLMMGLFVWKRTEQA